jgi:hypothetical protein
MDSLDTRNKNHLYVPALSLTCVQKGVSCSRVKIFNSLPSNRGKFKKELCKYLTIHSFYSITEFLDCNKYLLLVKAFDECRIYFEGVERK